MTDNTQFDRNNNVNDYDRYYGTVIDSEGSKVGDVGQVYLDDDTGRPEWVTVKTGLFGMNETFVPLRGETVTNGEIRVPYTKDQIKGAPSIDPEGHITEAEEAELYRYYSIEQNLSAYQDRDTTTVGTETAAGERAVGERADMDRDTNLADGEVVRHEERLNVGKEQVETGRVHIRKHVVNEQQSVQVPVTREELRVERTPITDGEVVDGGRLGEGETEVVLHEERPVVSKETVGVEKVSVGKEQVTENRTVTQNVAKERIEVEGDVDGNLRDRDPRDGDLRDERGLGDKVKDKLDRDNDGKVG
ncbi:uncharacterized protein (TIGR02271 family) [Luteococcus japonicus]|uniref:Uncharacterized protein (TIGR02271 family) n=1 Tax=Luteococcus japonicus TaxID=33984 RepID=A0A3N1ZRP3_9ACTN|nr:PRC and DUF2382 domain-containing protein [Luteococcus japonicus]ROR53564.1 uncharacterized protein (TIGR02271 family) [Luteococcus japonicus]